MGDGRDVHEIESLSPYPYHPNLVDLDNLFNANHAMDNQSLHTHSETSEESTISSSSHSSNPDLVTITIRGGYS